MADKVAKYGITESFETILVYHLCSNPRLFGRVGGFIEHDAMVTDAGKLAVMACKAIAADVGHGPDGSILVMQRLRRWRDEGKVTQEEILSVLNKLEAAEDMTIPSADAVAAEVSPLLRRRMQNKAVKTAMEEYAKNQDLSKTTKMLEQARRIGEVDESEGTQIGEASFDVINSMRFIDRLPTGVMELDAHLDGGLGRSQMGMFLGGPGDGKSMALSHVTGYTAMLGCFAGYVTLELPEAVVLARIIAMITGIPINAIMNPGEGAERARAMLRERKIGPIFVKSMTPMVTTVTDVADWVKRCEDRVGAPMVLTAIDYADKMSASGKEDKVVHQAMREVYEGLRVWNGERGQWLWTASQSTGRQSEKKAKKIDLEHTSDSMHKVRVVDLVVTLNAREEGEELLYYIAKNRTGRGRVSVGPLPTDFACGAVSPVTRPDGPPGEELFAKETERVLEKEEPGL